MKQLFTFVYFWNYFVYFWNYLETYVMRDDSDFSHTHKLSASFVFWTKNWSLLNSPNINRNLLFEVIVVFCYFLRFSHMYIVCWRLSPWKKDFTSVSLLHCTKKLGRSSYDVTVTHYDIILILFFFTFVANAWEFIYRGKKWPPPRLNRAKQT